MNYRTPQLADTARSHTGLSLERLQRGVSLMGFVIMLAVGGTLLLFASKCIPSWVEYTEVKRVLNRMSTSGDSDPNSIRRTFDLQASVAGITTLKGKDLEIIRANGGLEVSFAYETRIDIAGNMYVGFFFDGVYQFRK
jgi:hypothetical protein